ncbi:DUF2851 family protein [Roseibacillus ishigakijimensis]|uniref:DUF2851 family protein n=1 Tax=Roseibacillus ishigakijimensis TaxID=454146 RepID=A0A934RKW0_9BACT|nr:DUF2851 family protein [Roseibacillus ishigakijimensis]MBK1833587.1 DUF2851 family protein [Roseibacillus ishigakijimensis]
MSSRYQSFLQSLHSGWLAEEPLDLPGEMELQACFFAGQLGRHFTTLDGREVVIRQFGEWNHGPGPDFLSCAIHLDGRERVGPIELDLSPLDWENHGHATNPAFDEVVLHVSAEPAPRTTFIRTSEHREVPQVRLPTEKLTDLNPPRWQAPVTLGRCFQPLAEMELPRVEDLLREAARHRAHRKAARFRAVADTHGFPQALWQALANALGFHQNQLAMTLLAQRAPLGKMRHLPPLERTAYLFGLAGFLRPDLPEEAPPESHRWLRELWSSWWKNRPHPDPRPLPWRLAGVRPCNHPQRRVAALATLLGSWPTVERLAKGSLTDFAAQLQACSDSFWDQHYTLTSRASARPIALFGRQRVQDFLANVLHPLRLEDNPESHWPVYAKLPGGSPSERVQRAAYRLFGERPEKAVFLKKAWHQQALLQIYQDFCLRDHSDCQQCPFPEQLLSW